jgi:hypothetical protein
MNTIEHVSDEQHHSRKLRENSINVRKKSKKNNVTYRSMYV